MRQQLLDRIRPMRGRPCQNVLEVRIRFMPVHSGRLNQAHHCSRTLPSVQALGKQPIVAFMGTYS